MIIPALVKRYDDLAALGSGDLAPEGYSEQKISFEVVLNKDGTLHDIGRIFDIDEKVITKKVKGESVETVVKQERPRELLVPGQSKPSGSGLNPCFLWDNAAYMLGYKSDDLKPERTKAAFEAFRDRHLTLRNMISDPAFNSVCAFLESWRPSHAKKIKGIEEIAVGFGVFKIRAQTEFVHQKDAVRSWWESQQDARSQGELITGQSLTTGKVGALARLHEPKIKGVLGAQTSGATIVSFNQNSFSSYGKEQGENAPVGADDAFKYCTALNQLTTSDAHRVRIGGDTYVFWCEGSHKQDETVSAFVGVSLDDSRANDGKIHELLRKVMRGEAVEDLGSASTPFYILGLSPNAARLSVRMWLRSTVGEFTRRLTDHARNLEIIAPSENQDVPSIRRIVLETVPPKNGFPDADRVNPALAAELTRSILAGGKYPHALFSAVLDRVRTEGVADGETRKDSRDAQYRRCAILKACLVRNHQMEVSMALDIERTDQAYLLGRLFAVLERIQLNAMGEKLNRTIKDSFYASASATPGAVFPRLLNLKMHHIEKIDAPGQRIAREKEVGGIINQLRDFPCTLSMQHQGLFAIGYYHQRQNYFQKPSTNSQISE